MLSLKENGEGVWGKNPPLPMTLLTELRVRSYLAQAKYDELVDYLGSDTDKISFRGDLVSLVISTLKKEKMSSDATDLARLHQSDYPESASLSLYNCRPLNPDGKELLGKYVGALKRVAVVDPLRYSKLDLCAVLGRALCNQGKEKLVEGEGLEAARLFQDSLKYDSKNTQAM
jgi:hypothetical protein